MKPHYCLSYACLQEQLDAKLQALRQVQQQFRQLVRTVRHVFRVSRCQVQVPAPPLGPLVLRACFAHRREVPSWSLVQQLANDYLVNLPANLRICTGLDYWTPAGGPEYYFEVRVEWPPYLPN